MKAILVGLALLFSVGCEKPPSRTAEDVIRETNLTADKLERALDAAQNATAPVIAGIDTACAVAAPDFEGCKKANDLIQRFEIALDKAQLALDEYRKFTGTFADAARALAKVVEAGAEVVKAGVK